MPYFLRTYNKLFKSNNIIGNKLMFSLLNGINFTLNPSQEYDINKF